MPRVCTQAAYERATFPGLGPPAYFDPAEPRAWRCIELFYERVRISSGLYAASDCTILKFNSGRGRD